MQDNSISISFRNSVIERFADPDHTGPNSFKDYTDKEIKNFAKNASSNVLAGLHRWFNKITKVFYEEINRRASSN